MSKQQASDQQIKQKFHHHHSSKLQIYAENAIKRSNVKAFINQGVRISQKMIIDTNEQKNVSSHLLNLKSTCNQLSKDISNKQNDSIKLKDQTSFTCQKVKQLKSQHYMLQQKISQLTKSVQSVSTKKQVTTHTFKTYQNILFRMKKDEITNQLKTNAIQKQVINMEKQIKQYQRKLFALNQFEELGVKGLKDAQQQIYKEQQRRALMAIEINSSLKGKRIEEGKKMERLNQTSSIQEMAAGDMQDAQLIRMKKFLQVQIYLRCQLRSKMDRLKAQYSPYQLAFFQIKSQTSAKDAQSLKSQFFNFQSQYQQRTSWIKSLQKQIFALEQQRKQLKSQLIKTKQNQIDLMEQYQQETQTNGRHSYDREQRQNEGAKALQAELVMMKVKEWLNCQLKKTGLMSTPQKAKDFVAICQALIKNKNKPQQSSQQTRPELQTNIQKQSDSPQVENKVVSFEQFNQQAIELQNVKKSQVIQSEPVHC